MHVRTAAAPVRELGRELEQLVEELSACKRILAERLDDLGVAWSDAAFHATRQRATEILNELQRSANAAWAQAQWLKAQASRVEALAVDEAAVFSSASRNPESSAKRDGSKWDLVLQLPAISLGGKRFRLLDPASFRTSDFDWVTEQPEIDLVKPHHGLGPADYEEFVRAIPGILAATTAGIALDGRQRDFFSKLTNSEPVKLVRHTNGKVDVVNGRHRLWQAMRMGIAIPVVVE